MSLNEIDGVVNKLNDTVNYMYGSWRKMIWTIETTLYGINVRYLGSIAWSSANDQRDYDTQTLEDFLIHEQNTFIDDLVKQKLRRKNNIEAR